MATALNRDEWDNWSDSRDQVFQQAWANTRRYVPQGVYGTEEMAGQGQWTKAPEYGGYAWTPNTSVRIGRLTATATGFGRLLWLDLGQLRSFRLGAVPLWTLV